MIAPSSEDGEIGQLGRGSGPDLDLVADGVDAEHTPDTSRPVTVETRPVRRTSLLRTPART
jgi:hypothetical protein